MIKFVNINSGDVYDGSKPYVHWFDDEQSVGLNYSKTFLFVSDNESAKISLDSECFSLVDNTKLEEANKQTINGKDFLDLSKITSKQIQIQGVKTDDFYLFQFIVIAHGKYVGEITDEFFIETDEKYSFSIGADFYDENEALGTNLANFGQEISQEIQRAIYEKNIYEDKPDYILINRKYKELLNEYANIIANKGSYKSLINSLNWFEYGDLVKIYEYWRHGEPNKAYLSKQDITQYVNSITERLLSSMQKTTYISIGCAMQKMKDTDMSDPEYEPGSDENKRTVKYLKEPVPELEQAIMYWNRLEMSLKMTLLGNFFATYFMPIHLDLIHCTIEDVVYANTIKMTSDPLFERFDIYDGINNFQLHVDKLYHLSNVETFTNIDTPFGFLHNTGNSLNSEDAELSILGVDLKENSDPKLDPETKLKTYMLQHFKGIGAVVLFNCTLYNVFGTNVITDGDIKIYKNGKYFDGRKTYSIKQTSENGKTNISFNILFQEIGEYKVQIVFRRSDGTRYIKVVEFEVDEENYQTLDMYKLVPLDDKQRLNNSITNWQSDDKNKDVTKIQDLALWMMDPVKAQKNNWKIYTQFLSTSTDPEIKDCVRANRVVIIRIKGVTIPENINVRYGNAEKILPKDLKLKDLDLNKPPLCDGLRWIKTNRYGERIETKPDSEKLVTFGGGEYTFLIGVDSNFITDEYNPEFEMTPHQDIKYWVRDMFIPYFYELKKVGETTLSEQIVDNPTSEERFRKLIDKKTYEILPQDVVCFLPTLSSIKRPKDFQWKFVCKSTDDEITPLTYRSTTNNDFPTILAPLFGRYDFATLPNSGYYDVTLNYKLDDSQAENSSVTVSSQFIVKK